MKWLAFFVVVVALLALSVWIIGYFLPQSHRVERSVWLPRSSQEVFDLVSRVEQHPLWRNDIQTVRLENRQDGGLVVIETGTHGELRYSIERMEPPAVLVTRIVDETDFGGTWTISVREENSGTRVSIREDGEVFSPLFRFFSAFVFGHERTVETYLKSLAKHLGSTAELQTP